MIFRADLYKKYIYLFNFTLKKKNIKNSIIFILNYLVLFNFSTRKPCVLIGLITYVFLFNFKKTNKKLTTNYYYMLRNYFNKFSVKSSLLYNWFILEHKLKSFKGVFKGYALWLINLYKSETVVNNLIIRVSRFCFVWGLTSLSVNPSILSPYFLGFNILSHILCIRSVILSIFNSNEGYLTKVSKLNIHLKSLVRENFLTLGIAWRRIMLKRSGVRGFLFRFRRRAINRFIVGLDSYNDRGQGYKGSNTLPAPIIIRKYDWILKWSNSYICLKYVSIFNNNGLWVNSNEVSKNLLFINSCMLCSILAKLNSLIFKMYCLGYSEFILNNDINYYYILTKFMQTVSVDSSPSINKYNYKTVLNLNVISNSIIFFSLPILQKLVFWNFLFLKLFRLLKITFITKRNNSFIAMSSGSGNPLMAGSSGSLISLKKPSYSSIRRYMHRHWAVKRDNIVYAPFKKTASLNRSAALVTTLAVVLINQFLDFFWKFRVNFINRKNLIIYDFKLTFNYMNKIICSPKYYFSKRLYYIFIRPLKLFFRKKKDRFRHTQLSDEFRVFKYYNISIKSYVYSYRIHRSRFRKNFKVGFKSYDFSNPRFSKSIFLLSRIFRDRLMFTSASQGVSLPHNSLNTLKRRYKRKKRVRLKIF